MAKTERMIKIQDIEDYIEEDDKTYPLRPPLKHRASHYKTYTIALLEELKGFIKREGQWKQQIKELKAKVKRLKKKRTIGTRPMLKVKGKFPNNTNTIGNIE